jgi:hypothetical protein
MGSEGCSELGGGVVVEPEAAAEADLAGPVALGGEVLSDLLARVPAISTTRLCS